MSSVEGRSFVVGYYGLQLDGFDCGIIPKIEYGGTEGVVTEIAQAYDYYKSKQIAQVKYNEITAQLGLSMSENLRAWIQSSLDMNYQRKSGEVQFADFKRKVCEVLEFKDALPSAITFPALDAAAKDASMMTLKIKPWITRRRKGGGETVENKFDANQKAFHNSDFRIEIDGCGKACSKISKMDALEIKQSFVRDEVGLERDNFEEPGAINYPNIKITTSTAVADEFEDWFQSFVIDGVNTDDVHKTMAITYLNRTRQKELLTLNVSGLGIFKLSRSAAENNKDEISRTTIEMYCEKITAKFA
jgi:hypothetical protein